MNEEAILQALSEVTRGLNEIKKPSINWSAIIGTLIAALAIGAFTSYITVTKALENHSSTQIQLKKDIDAIKKDLVPASIINSHIRQNNWNFKVISTKLNIQLYYNEQ